jgi:hypothetical protein
MLKDYEHINEDEFEFIEPNLNPFSSVTQAYMHNSHRTLVPIGHHFQATLPPIMTPTAYRIKTAEQMKNLRMLKINDPEEGELFYSQHFAQIEELFGPGRTYEDVIHLQNAFKKMNSLLTFDSYITKNAKYW